MAFLVGGAMGATGSFDRCLPATLGQTLETAFSSAHQGFSVEAGGRKSARRIRRRAVVRSPRGGGASIATRRRSGNGNPRATSTTLDRKHSPALASSAAMRLAWRTAASWSACSHPVRSGERPYLSTT